MAWGFSPSRSNSRANKPPATFSKLGARVARHSLSEGVRLAFLSRTDPSHKTHTSLSDSSRPTVRLPQDRPDVPVPHAWLVSRPDSAASIGSRPRWFALESITARWWRRDVAPHEPDRKAKPCFEIRPAHVCSDRQLSWESASWCRCQRPLRLRPRITRAPLLRERGTHLAGPRVRLGRSMPAMALIAPSASHQVRIRSLAWGRRSTSATCPS